MSDSDDDLKPHQTQLENDRNVNIIDGEEEEDDDFNPRVTNSERQDEPMDKDSESEDEFAYLVADARANAAKEQESAPAAAPADNKQSHEDTIKARIKERLEQYRKTGSLAKSASDSGTSKPTPPVDPKVEILVTSTIEGTKPLKFIRKLSQRLKEVREHWCDRQDIDLSESQKESIFLTWKSTKLFDSTTCQRMPGLRIYGGEVDTYGEGFEDGKLHMEAWTPETFQEYQRSKALSRPRYAEDYEGEGNEREPTPEPEPEGPKWRLVLKCRGIDDFKLVVKGRTRIAKIISSYQSERDIEEGKEISLWFDGDMLDPEGYADEMEFEDYDVIEVQVK